MIRRVSAKDARNKLSELLGKVCYGREIVIVEKQKKPMVAMIPVDQLEAHLRTRNDAFRNVEAIRESLPDFPDPEVRKDVNEAIKAVRNKKPA